MALIYPVQADSPEPAEDAAPDFAELAADLSDQWLVEVDLGEDDDDACFGPLNAKDEFGAIQPTILAHSATEIQILLRSRQRVIAEAWSKDGGVSWGRMTATSLPNPSAGIDALRLADGRFLLVYNPSATSRATLALAVSGDGKAWRQVTMLEDESQGEFSYPAMIQSRDGRVHITYTWRREKIKHVAVDPATIEK